MLTATEQPPTPSRPKKGLKSIMRVCTRITKWTAPPKPAQMSEKSPLSHLSPQLTDAVDALRGPRTRRGSDASIQSLLDTPPPPYVASPAYTPECPTEDALAWQSVRDMHTRLTDRLAPLSRHLHTLWVMELSTPRAQHAYDPVFGGGPDRALANIEGLRTGTRQMREMMREIGVYMDRADAPDSVREVLALVEVEVGGVEKDVAGLQKAAARKRDWERSGRIM